MRGWVLDTSIVMAWCLPDEASPVADRFFGSLAPTTPLRVPGLFWYEVAQVLSAARRRGRLLPNESTWIPQLLEALPLETSASSPKELRSLTDLALQTGLSAYDAAYLELATRLECGLATCDRQLARVAQDRGVTLWEPTWEPT